MFLTGRVPVRNIYQNCIKFLKDVTWQILGVKLENIANYEKHNPFSNLLNQGEIVEVIISVWTSKQLQLALKPFQKRVEFFFFFATVASLKWRSSVFED